MTKEVKYEKILILERGLKEGDVIDYEPRTKCLKIFSSKSCLPDLRWHTSTGDDNKMYADCGGKINFCTIAEVIAQTHGMEIERYHEVSDSHWAYIFKKKRKSKESN